MDKFTGVKVIEDRAEFEKKRRDYFLLATDLDDVKSLHYKNSAAVKVNNEIYAAKFGCDPTQPRVGECRFINSAVEDKDSLIFGTDEKVLIESVEPVELNYIDGYQCTLAGINTASVFVPASWAEANIRIKEKAREGNRLNRIFKNDPSDTNKRLKNQAWWNYYEFKNALVDLRLPFACTIHKSQGSTYNAVFIDLAEIGTCTVAETIARLLYVGISRARENVFITGALPKRLANFNREVDF